MLCVAPIYSGTYLAEISCHRNNLYIIVCYRYTLELTDLQVMTGKMKDNWKHIHHRNTTPLHLVDRFTITLQLER